MEVIYDRYARPAYSLLFRITRDQGSSEDLLQEAFVHVWNRASSFEPARGTLGAWILSVTRHLAIDYLRSRQGSLTRGTRSIDDIDSLYSKADFGAEALPIDQSLAIKTALLNLSSAQRTVLELAYFEGFSQAEIAARLQKPLGTVKSHMRAALHQLRTSLTADGSQKITRHPNSDGKRTSDSPPATAIIRCVDADA